MGEQDLSDYMGTGRQTDIGGNPEGGRETDLGGSHSGGDAQDLRATGDGQTVRTGRNPISKEDAEHADVPREGTPEDLKLGKRRTAGLDEDDGAGLRDLSGTPDSTTGGG